MQYFDYLNESPADAIKDLNDLVNEGMRIKIHSSTFYIAQTFDITGKPKSETKIFILYEYEK